MRGVLLSKVLDDLHHHSAVDFVVPDDILLKQNISKRARRLAASSSRGRIRARLE